MSALMKLMLTFKYAKKVACLRPRQYRGYVADLAVNHKVKIDPKVKAALEDGSIKSPKKHPGLVTVRAVKLPKELVKAMEDVLEKYPVKDVRTKGDELYRRLWSRKLKEPTENVRHKAEQLRLHYLDKVLKHKDINALNSDEKRDILDGIETKVDSRILKETHNWKPMTYNAYTSLQYMLSRLPTDYSVMYQLFSEILKRDGSFHPRTMFDFGSGTGSAIWASQAVWPQAVYEYMCVDASADMNTLSRILLQGGSEDADMLYKGVHHLQYLPNSHPHTYDLVVSGFSFMELSSRAERLQTLLSMWQKTERYLILVENGTNAGFQLVSEARDFLLQVGAEGSVPELIGHVFAPCPHDQLCPRGLRKDGTPCNFEITTDYLPKHLQTANTKPFRFSYVVLKKGERDTSVPAWPRLVRPTSKPTKRVNCRTCTANAELERTVITAAKHGRELLRCARACRWGDLVPMVTNPEAEAEDEEIPSNVDTMSSTEGGEETPHSTKGSPTTPDTSIYGDMTFTSQDDTEADFLFNTGDASAAGENGADFTDGIHPESRDIEDSRDIEENRDIEESRSDAMRERINNVTEQAQVNEMFSELYEKMKLNTEQTRQFSTHTPVQSSDNEVSDTTVEST